MQPVLLTICIATYNRATYLPETLLSIVHQLRNLDDVEVLVVDGNSTDDTEAVVTRVQATCPYLNYLKLKEKGGVDKDFDIAVRSASGLYCWLFTDDDLLKDGAVSKVREAALRGEDLIVVNAEICDYEVRRVLNKSALGIESDVMGDFTGSHRDDFFKLCASYITFIGSIVMRKEAWSQVSREVFYGTRFIHVGVISTLSDTARVRVMAEPLIQIRLGNAEWSNIAFRVWTQLWPNLIWSFANLSAECRRAICRREPWRSMTSLLWYRALGTYSATQYVEHIRPKENSLHKAAAALIVRIPRFPLRLAYYCYAGIRRDKMQLYCLGDGGKSRNSWLSKS